MRYRFGGVVVDTDTYELRSGGRLVEVEPQVFGVLAHLLAHRDRVVAKDELLDTVWGNRFVSESALTTRIKQARQAVGDDGQAQRVIRTVHGRGYRLVAAVEEAGDGHAGDAGDEPALDPVPATRYVQNDGASIAFQVFGEGPDLVLIEGFTTNLEVQWEHPAIARFLRRLGGFCRVAVVDKRGTGLSERLGPGEAPPLEQRADDVRAVMDAAGMDRATVFGSSEGGALSVLLAAAHPERVERLILHGTWARHPWYDDADRREPAMVESRWGTGWTFGRLAGSMASTAAGRRFFGRYERQSATPGTARRLAELMQASDVTPLLASISAPTLVIHRHDDVYLGPDAPRPLVDGIAGARLVELPGTDHFLFSGDTGPLLAAVEDFVVGAGPGAPGPAAAAAAPDRFLATLLAVAVAGGSPEAGAAARRCVAEHRGTVVNAAGLAGVDLLATFDGPGRAVRAACALRDALAPLGAEVRAGVHTAEVERRDGGVWGAGVAVAAGIAGVAEPGAVWVSRTVPDLVAGSGLAFVARGAHDVPGGPGPAEMFEVAV
jgi:pimeloyl-ACP methyl ester carboxylesterase/DNA-binding winged helix-turn-helix (wHTH) protein